MMLLMTIMTMWPRWELCGPFINTCKRLLSSLITAEPKLIRTVADRKKLLTKVIFKALLAVIFPHHPGILICMCEALADLQVWGPVITSCWLMEWPDWDSCKVIIMQWPGGAVVTSQHSIGCHDRLDQIWLWLLSYGLWVMLRNTPRTHYECDRFWTLLWNFRWLRAWASTGWWAVQTRVLSTFMMDWDRSAASE